MRKCNYDEAIKQIANENISTFEKKTKIAELKKKRIKEIKNIHHPDLDEYIFSCFQLIASEHNFSMEDLLDYLDLKIVNPYVEIINKQYK